MAPNPSGPIHGAARGDAAAPDGGDHSADPLSSHCYSNYWSSQATNLEGTRLECAIYLPGASVCTVLVSPRDRLSFLAMITDLGVVSILSPPGDRAIVSERQRLCCPGAEVALAIACSSDGRHPVAAGSKLPSAVISLLRRFLAIASASELTLYLMALD
eukprot:4104889-Pleurochrysis_carterae.AAC.1